MSDTDEKGGGARKKRRVTKACDQCRKKRVRCEVYPDALPDAPCVVCCDANTAAGCTFSRPSRKRGYAKSLTEKVNTLERLLGHLLLTNRGLMSLTDDFFSPPPSSTTTAEAQSAAFQSSPLPALLDAVLPAPAATNSPSTVGNSSAPHADIKPLVPPLATTSPADDRMSTGGWSPAAQSPPIASGSTSSPFSALSLSQRQVLGLPLASAFGRPPSNGLQTLANAAAKDSDYTSPFRSDGRDTSAENGRGKCAMESEERPGGEGSSRGAAFPALTLPSESVRNQLVDLYFNQIVHPCYPMVDKARFFRWTAHLPATNASTSAAASSLPAELYLAVFALVTPYLAPSVASTTHRAEVFAAASRAHLFAALDQPSIETVQACCLLALSDWGLGELNRAWTLSSLAIALAINLSLHISASRVDNAVLIQTDPTSSKLKTFHSALIIHALLSLRLQRPPMTILEDYDVPVPPQDGPENFELWRCDKSPEELRADHDALSGPARHHLAPRTLAVRSCALSTFSSMASLCAIALAVVRWTVCPRRGNGRGLAGGEQEREELVASLGTWEKELPLDLRLSDQLRGVERLHERARHTVEMHLLLFTLYLRLAPHISFQSMSYDPVPQALAIKSHIFARYLDLFTFYRSLPTVELSLHSLSTVLFTRPDYSPHQHDVPLKAYDELAAILPVARQGLEELKDRVDRARRERGLKQSFPGRLTSLIPSPHPSIPSPQPPPTAPSPVSSTPFLDQSLFTSVPDPALWENVSQWDQTDLLVSLGLVSDPTHSTPWQPPSEMVLEPVGEQVYGYDLLQQQQSTDLLTRWLDRGSLGFDGTGL